MFKKIIVSFIVSLLLCFNALAQSVTIFTTNDLHGRLKPFDYGELKDVGGAARRTTVFKSVPNALILDAGDYAQGTLYFKLLKENLNLKVMESQGYDAITLGNHEFDKGLAYLMRSAVFSKVPLLLSNVKFQDKELNKIINKYVIEEVNGVKIGIIGVIDSSLKATSSTNPDLYEVYDEIKTLKKIVRKVDRKTDLVIVLSHCGADKDRIIAREVNGIDLIIGGHTHTTLRKPIQINKSNGERVLISQNGEFGRLVGKWDIVVENDRIKRYKFRHIPITSKIPEDATTKGIIAKYDKMLDDYAKTVAGYSVTPIDARRKSVRTRLTTAGALLHDAIKYHYPEVEVSMNTSGGYRFGDYLPQVITNQVVEELFPFDSYVVLVKIKGSDIKEILETSSRFLPKSSSSFLQTSGLSYTVHFNRQPKCLNSKYDKIIQSGAKVSNVKVNGKPLDMEKYYLVATDNFMYYGGDGYIEFRKYKDVKHTHFFLDDILIKYLQINSPVEVKVKDRIIYKK